MKAPASSSMITVRRGVGVLGFYLQHIIPDEEHDFARVIQQVFEVVDLLYGVGVFLVDLLAVRAGRCGAAACRGWPEPGPGSGLKNWIKLVRASSTVGDWRIVAIMASRLSRAILKPSRM